jgi:hypothetical protein
LSYKKEVDFSRIRLEIVLATLAQRRPTKFAKDLARDIVASDCYVASFLEAFGLGGLL